MENFYKAYWLSLCTIISIILFGCSLIKALQNDHVFLSLFFILMVSIGIFVYLGIVNFFIFFLFVMPLFAVINKFGKFNFISGLCLAIFVGFFNRVSVNSFIQDLYAQWPFFLASGLIFGILFTSLYYYFENAKYKITY